MGTTLRTRALFLSFIITTIGFTSVAHAQWAGDDFDSYAAGSLLGGQGGWQPWDGDPAVDAPLTDLISYTPTNSLELSGDQDIVRLFTGISTGIWRISSKIQIPGGMTGTAYWILMNTYDGSGSGYNWSVQTSFVFNGGGAFQVTANDLGGSTFAGGGATVLDVSTAGAASAADFWLEIRTDVDFDNNEYRNYLIFDPQEDYENPDGDEIVFDLTNGTVCPGPVTCPGLGSAATWFGGTGQAAFEGMDLYSAGTSGFYYDSINANEIDAIGGNVLTTCPIFDLVDTSSDCVSGDVTIDWNFLFPQTDPGTTVTIARDGTTLATVPWDDFTYLDTGVASGVHEYTLTSQDTAPTPCIQVANATHTVTVYTGQTDIIVEKNAGQGRHDGSSIEDALIANGSTVLYADLLDPCFPDPTTNDYRVWISIGTFPDDGQLTAPEGDALVALHLAGVSVYMESGDHWGFHPDTAWRQYDGVDQDLIVDGGDGMDYLTGLDSGLGLDLTNHLAFYYHDQEQNEWTDQLAPADATATTPDLSGTDAAAIWQTEDVISAATYSTGIYYAGTTASVVSVSWELGGFTGDQNALVAQYIEAMGGPAAACVAPGPLVATSDCGTGELTLTWSGSHDSYEVFKNGTSVGTYPSGATEHVEVSDSGIFDYEVRGTCGAATASGLIEVVHGGDGTGDHVVVRLERQQGGIDSARAIFDALIANGEDAMVVSSPEDPCFPLGSGATIWVELGTWPSNHVLTDVEADLIVQEHTANSSKVYLAGADHWIDVPTAWASYDGVDFAADGDDSFIAMVGLESGFGLDLTGFDAAYNQDMVGNDFTDQLTLAGPGQDLGGDNLGFIWQDDTATYNTGIHYASSFADVLSITWEFGGYAGDQVALMERYLTVMGSQPPGDLFVRGDANADGNFDISDAVFSLSALFVGGSSAPTCADAGDANNDGNYDISDAVFTLSALFVAGSPPPPAPHPDCGVDSALPADTLDCAAFAPCMP